jgi:hypothetical protein
LAVGKGHEFFCHGLQDITGVAENIEAMVLGKIPL